MTTSDPATASYTGIARSLYRAMLLFMPPDSWTRSAEAVNAHGEPVAPSDAGAVAFSIVGAARRVAANGGEFNEMMLILTRVTRAGVEFRRRAMEDWERANPEQAARIAAPHEPRFRDLAEWNDAHPGVERYAVIGIISSAISSTQRPEQLP